MKYLFYIFLSVLLGCQSNTGRIDATASFAEKEYNFGVLDYKKPVQHRLTVKNIGKSPLIINNVETSCGCTVPDWSKEPIKPGKGGEIIITYDSDFPGIFRKTITVFYNGSESPDTLIIKGEVKYPEEMNNL